MILTAFQVFDRIETISWKRILPAVFLALLTVCLFEFLSEKEPDYLALSLSLVLVLLYGILLLLRSFRAGRARLIMILLFAFTFSETAGMAFYGFGCNGQIKIDKFYSDTKAIEEVKEMIPEDELYRTCLISPKMLDEDIWHGLKSVGIFGSTASGGAVSMMDHWGFYTAANEYLYKGATPLTNVLFNVKYQIRRGEDSNRHDFEIIKSYDDMDLLGNPYETAIGYSVDGYLEDWNYKTVYPFDVQNGFAKEAYGVDDIFHVIEIADPEIYDGSIARTNRGEFSFTYESVQDDNMVFTIPVEEDGDLYIHYDGSRVENTIIRVDEEIRVNDDIDSEVFHVGLVEAGSFVTVHFKMKDDGRTNGVVRLSAAMFDHGNFRLLHEKMMERSVEVTEFTSSSLKGYVTSKEEGTLLFSIPYDSGWTVLIDGQKMETFAVADGMLAVNVEAGSHEISMEYVSPGFKTGLKLTIAGTALWLLSYYVVRKKMFGSGSVDAENPLQQIDPCQIEEKNAREAEEGPDKETDGVGL